MRPRRSLLTLLFGLFVASRAGAQVAAGDVSGLIVDPDGRAIVGATVTITRIDTNSARSAITGDGGAYAIVSLAPGVYDIAIVAPGFAPYTARAVQVTTGEKVRVDATLAIGGIAQKVVVTTARRALRTDSAGLGNSIPHEWIVQLPLNGRSFITLAALTPGVAVPPGSQFPRITGGRPRTNEYLFDGISVLQPEPGQVAFVPIIDAIEEFRIESNSPPAEFGRFNGGVINLTTRSGTNALRGTAFGFVRHEALNARHYFAPPGSDRPRFRRQQVGGVLGGPLLRDRTFFFVDYQAHAQSIARTAISTVPTLLQRAGVFTEAVGERAPAIHDPATRDAFAGSRVPLERMDPVALALLDRYPLPTAAGTANNYRRVDNERDRQHQGDVRLDHQVAARHSAFARVSHVVGSVVPVAPLPDGSGVASGTLGPQTTTAWATASAVRSVVLPHLFNELRMGDARRHVRREAAQLGSSAGAVLRIPGIPSDARFPNALPTFLISGYQQLGSPPNTSSDFRTSVGEIADTLTWVRGRHTIKTGFDWRWERLDVVQPPSPTGAFTFNALGSDLPGTADTGTPLASFLLGQVQTFSIDLQQQQIEERARIQEYFVQDDWKAADRLTVNAGMRYTLNFPSIERNGQTAVFNLQAQRLEYPGAAPVRALKKNNFGPRGGVVYRVTERTALSAGYGLIWIEMAGITTPFTTPSFPFLQTISQRALDTRSPAFVLSAGPSVAPLAPTPLAGLGQGVFAVDANLGSGYAQQWNASVQRELTANTVVEAAYLGSTITRVGVPDTNLNQLTVAQLALGPALFERVANPFFGVVPRSSSLGDPTIPVAQLMKPYPAYTTVSLYRNNIGTTRYDGFTLSMRRQLADGWSYSAAYTRSTLIDDASSVFDASILTGPVAHFPVADSFDRGRERDYSTGDLPHVFVASALWAPAVPFLDQWTLTAILTLQSGIPVAVTQATNVNAFAGFGTQRPNMVSDPELPRGGRTAARWFNTAAFATAPQFTLGTASRNPVRGPAFRNLDLAVIRRIGLPGLAAAELRLEAFNLLNTPALGNPNGVFGTASFGTITTAGDPRVLQAAVKIHF